MLPKHRPEDLCGDPEWQVPHLFAYRTLPGGGKERRCEYCGIVDLRETPALPALPNLVPAFGAAAAFAVLCTIMPRIAALLERIAIALETR